MDSLLRKRYKAHLYLMLYHFFDAVGPQAGF